MPSDIDAKAANPPRRFALGLKGIGLVAFVALTNPGFVTYAAQYIEQHRWSTLVVFLALWTISLAAILVAAFQPNTATRVFWAALIPLSAAVGFGFYRISGNEISMFDVASLWTARHEAGRALDYYTSIILASVLVFLFGFAVIAAPVPVLKFFAPRWRQRIAQWAPAFPILLFVAVIYVKEGGGFYGMPVQFAPVSVAALSGVKIATHTVPPREQVQWTPSTRKIRNVVLVVDESVRGDYIDWTPGNSTTPELAKLKPRLIDFGPASSGGNCSSYSNAILRFGASRRDLMQSVMSNATVWQYAKAAGYRTVFIDAQAAFVKGPDKLQNYMTAAERRQIDSFNAIDESVPTAERDDKLVGILTEALKSDQPTFIYAVKNGAHFPYDRAYPSSESIFHPTMTEAGNNDGAALINSYRNALRWSVDRIFKKLVDSAPLDDTLIVYTSDHGQNLSTTALSHCSTDNADPREGLVPLLAVTQQPELRKQLAARASANFGQFTHFAIVPTLLDAFGFAPKDIASKHGPSLFEQPDGKTDFSSGDIFGLITSTIRWNRIDLSKVYLEKGTNARAASQSPAKAQ